jgi:Pentapeptide repeats (8 copies)
LAREKLLIFFQIGDNGDNAFNLSASFPMPRPVISQPLPMDIRNWSFRGLDCEGWDFEGRDIRGCDFRNANLNNTNFSRSLTGKSRKQNLSDAVSLFLIVIAGAFTGVFAAAMAGAFLGAFASAFMMVGAVVGAFLSAVSIVSVIGQILSIPGAVPGAFSGGFGGVLAVVSLAAIEDFGKGRFLSGILLIPIMIVPLVISCFLICAAIQEFRSAVGTNFKGATLLNADFNNSRSVNRP